MSLEELLDSAKPVEEDEEEEQEQEEDTAEAQEKPAEPQKPSVDHSIPPRERIEQERDKLKFEATVFGNMERQAAKIIGDLILWEFDNYPEREGEWDHNEWTLVDFLKAFSDEAKKQCQAKGNQALFAGRTEDPNDPTMQLIRDIIHTKNEPKKPAKQAKPAETKKPAKQEKPKPKPKPEPEPKSTLNKDQLLLDLGF